MKLTYRGIGYDSEPQGFNLMEAEIGGKYRGNDWQVRYPRHIPVPATVNELSYRGARYNSGETVTTPVAPVTAKTGRVRHLMDAPPGEKVMEEVAKLHRNNICRSLERRMQAAKMLGNKDLMEQLQMESQQLTCYPY
ncbi:DUF4278 domain-containing protein [Laspinema olomoucense]|uniref:DUF4278 domain-containing protein n=1 Tax=Laspinema olomoucense D3b TaxID=2953688 RepID=A0ABT2NI14_9CYAN|nr:MULTISPECIES: DUF4278 domain-containing protein [unclassified Laspinema]MCT7971537.1 DUF4278 domain-containing protein [Laspinema sp. D3d]MCT7980931.1 DUF4278 domain-containing protein [Laspinema sp. D3b]MCT7990939.1 DUF4278 domain-containing protein [Laspinema sp. D3a]MCT7995422.1 DUF4278 domain-containing protein [Laspinema sp. D3c]